MMKHNTESSVMADRLYQMAEKYIREEKEVRIFFMNPILSVSEEIRQETEARINGKLREKESDLLCHLIRHEEDIEMQLIRKKNIDRKVQRYMAAHAIKERK